MNEKNKITRRDFLKAAGITSVGIGALTIGGIGLSSKPALAAVNTPKTFGGSAPAAIPETYPLITPNNKGQTVIPAATIPKFIDPLPVLNITGLSNGTIDTIVTPTSQVNIEAKEFKANMLPSGFIPGYSGTWVWGYVRTGTDTSTTRDTYTGPVIVAVRGTPNTFKFTNNLPTTVAASNVLAYKYAIDQSLHWAHPDPMMDVPMYVPNVDALIPWLGNPDHYSGGIPMAVHVHGAEDPAAVDGGPDSWFLSDGSKVGKGFYSEGWDGQTPQNYCIYTYPNTQEASPIWFHDHTLGATRLNVYCGLAGAYLLIDPNLVLPAGLTATGLGDLPPGDIFNPPETYDDILIPLVIQDRMFDQNGQLYFPAGPDDPVNPALNPEHQYWAPEFFGEAPNVSAAICVNGKTWPYLDVPNERQRFLLINGSNARSYILTFKNSLPNFAGYTPAYTNTVEPDIWQISTDQGYLDSPVKVDALVIMPGERAEFIVDFGTVGVGNSVVLHNFAPDVPLNDLSGADQNDPNTTGTIIQFRVGGLPGVIDTHYNPASGIPIRTGSQKIVRLSNGTGGLATGVTPILTRALTLNELAVDSSRVANGYTWQGGPLEILVNNSKWHGLREDFSDPNQMTFPPLTPVNGGKPDGIGDWLTELPAEGTTEVWEIMNLTMDAHPIHTHLVQFQLINRQQFAGDLATLTGGYYDFYRASFPGGTFIPAYGPPLSYGPSTDSGGKYGGNPNINPFLTGFPVEPPLPNEVGWKDTVRCPPNYVTRFIARFAPQDKPVVYGPTTIPAYAFVPSFPNQANSNAFYDYVWHCHIVDHEDNEMMRPYAVFARTNVSFDLGKNPVTGLAATVTATFVDTIYSQFPDTHRAVIDWGDGSITAGKVVSEKNGTGNVIETHKYAASGTYKVTVYIIEKTWGGVGFASIDLVVKGPK